MGGEIGCPAFSALYGMEYGQGEGQEDVLNDINSLDLDLENTANEAKDTILNNGTNSLEMITEIKLNREQVRAQNKEVLMGIINNAEHGHHQRNLFCVIKSLPALHHHGDSGFG